MCKKSIKVEKCDVEKCTKSVVGIWYGTPDPFCRSLPSGEISRQPALPIKVQQLNL